MLISQKQQEANRRNAQQSTGPQTPEGKDATRFNALKYGLCARSLFIPREDPGAYDELWNDLLAEWQPQTRSERIYLEQMATSHWLLARAFRSENEIYHNDPMLLTTQFGLLTQISTLRTRLERAFASGQSQLEHLQRIRKSKSEPRPVQPARPAVPAPAGPPAPPPAYVMSEEAEAHPVLCAPVPVDSR